MKFRKLRSLYRENKKLDLHKTFLILEFDIYVVILNWLCYIKFIRVSAYCNYPLVYILLLDVFCRTIWVVVEYMLHLPVAILCCLLTIHYYISYVFHEALLTKLSIIEVTMVTVKSIADCIPYY